MEGNGRLRKLTRTQEYFAVILQLHWRCNSENRLRLSKEQALCIRLALSLQLEIDTPTEILDTPKEISITPRVFQNTPKVTTVIVKLNN